MWLGYLFFDVNFSLAYGASCPLFSCLPLRLPLRDVPFFSFAVVVLGEELSFVGNKFVRLLVLASRESANCSVERGEIILMYMVRWWVKMSAISVSRGEV